MLQPPQCKGNTGANELVKVVMGTKLTMSTISHVVNCHFLVLILRKLITIVHGFIETFHCDHS